MRSRIHVASLLAVALTGCGGGGGSRSSTGSTAPAATTPSTPTSSAPFVVTTLSPASAPAASTKSLALAFSEPVEATTLIVGTTLVAFEDRDTNPGGSFAEMPGTVALDATGKQLAFTPTGGFHVDREVRIELARGVHSKTGKSLERGSASSPISFAARLPDGVYEGRFAPTAASATSPAPAPAPPSPAPPAPAPPAPAPPPAPSASSATFQPEAGTDVWHLDFDLRATTFANDMANHGLRANEATVDALAQERVKALALSYASQKYERTADGRAVAGKSWKISFTSQTPPGAGPGRSHSREAVGGAHATNPKILGVSIYDAGNRGKEDNSRSGSQGIFSFSIGGLKSRLTPSLTAADRKFLDGTYKLGAGTATDDARMVAIATVCDDFGHALGSIVAHEVGHSVGLAHDESDPKGLMKASTSPTLMSDKATHFSNNSAATLTANLGKSP